MSPTGEKKEKLIHLLNSMNKDYKNLKQLAPLLKKREQEGWKYIMDNLSQQIEIDKQLIINNEPISSININFQKTLRPFTKKILGIDVNSIPISTPSGKRIRKSWLRRKGIEKDDLIKTDYFYHI